MDTPAKQQIAERVKQANNILVTVSNNPSVDQLAAAIGLTLMLNRMGKHATAVFSGKIPSTIEFLQPEKTIETNTDSLRDFIISLDKSKADKLRYKVEDQVVRIFITPYRTSLGEKDLVFSQGDFNVEVIVALGVRDRSQLDAAITAHGRILHDATAISLDAGPGNPPNLGQINWQDPSASSLCEMLVSISEAFGPGLIDNQMATAFLTGIVARTDRFSNNKTSPKVMTMSAQLMAAGANQQLIVSKLEPPVPKEPPKPPPPPPPPPPPKHKPPKVPLPPPPPKPQTAPKSENDGKLSIAKQTGGTDSGEISIDPNEIHIDEQGNLKTTAELQSKSKEEGIEPKTEEKPEEKTDDKEKKEDDEDIADKPDSMVATPPPPAIEDSSTSSLPPLPPLSSLPPISSDVVPPSMPPMPTPPPPFDPVTINPTMPPAQQPLPPPPPPIVPQPSLAENPGQHSFINPSGGSPNMSAPFTSNTSDNKPTVWSSDSNSVPINPLGDTAPVNNSEVEVPDGSFGHAKVIQPPNPHNTPLDVLLNRAAEVYPPQAQPSAQNPVSTQSAPLLSTDNARMAVEQAVAAQTYNPSYPSPIQGLGAQPLGPDLRGLPPTPAIPYNGTPSLNLPSNGNGLPPAPFAPPPLPPPLPGSPNVYMPPPQNPS